jgi:diguanylate cyclase (GGDEF)-like protein
MLVEPEYADSDDYAEFWRTLARGSHVSGLYRRVGRDGRLLWIQASYNPIPDVNGRPSKITKIATDVTSNVLLAEAFDDARRQAHHDSATALPNRVRLMGFMSGVLAEPDMRLVVLYLDLDRFKPINDTHGHHVGDRVLGEVADRLRRSLRDGHMAARIGGDEFVVACPRLDQDEIGPLCDRLIATVAAPIQIDGLALATGLSIGVAVAPADGRTPEALLRCADAALYRSKQNGRGTYTVFSASPDPVVAA